MNVLSFLGAVLIITLAGLGCNPGKKKAVPAAGSAAHASANPETAAPKSSAATPTPDPKTLGTLTGTVRVKGDPSPKIESIASKLPVGKCFAAHETYSKLLREGPDRTLADVLVAVTEYQGGAPLPTEPVVIEAKDCAYDRRTVVMAHGQKLQVHNAGNEVYTPQLLGSRMHALLMVAPRSDPVELTAENVGQYQLIDRTHQHVFADVFVLNYASTDVTGIDGKFQIAGLPTGRAKLNALLPATGQTLIREIEIRAGETLNVDLEFEFDVAKHGEKAAATPVPAKQ